MHLTIPNTASVKWNHDILHCSHQMLNSTTLSLGLEENHGKYQEDKIICHVNCDFSVSRKGQRLVRD